MIYKICTGSSIYMSGLFKKSIEGIKKQKEQDMEEETIVIGGINFD